MATKPSFPKCFAKLIRARNNDVELTLPTSQHQNRQISTKLSKTTLTKTKNTLKFITIHSLIRPKVFWSMPLLTQRGSPNWTRKSPRPPHRPGRGSQVPIVDATSAPPREAPCGSSDLDVTAEARLDARVGRGRHAWWLVFTGATMPGNMVVPRIYFFYFVEAHNHRQSP